MKFFKRFIFSFLSIFVIVTLSYSANYNNLPVKFLLDPANPFLSLPIALPNDMNILILDQNGSLSLPINSDDSVSVKGLKTAINSLGLKGLAPNTCISIPLNSSEPLDLNTLYSNIAIIPFMKNLSNSPVYNLTPNILAGPKKLLIYQDNNVLKISFKTQLDPNSKYVLIINKGVKTLKGDLVGRDPAFEFLMRDKDYYLPVIQGLNLNIEDILAMFTFSTADKTLKLSAFSKLLSGSPYGIEDILDYNSSKSELATMLSAANILPSSVRKSSVEQYLTLTYLKTEFTSYDIATSMSNLINVPAIILPNGVTNKVVIFQHGLGGDKTRAFAIASKFLSAGFPIISIDMTKHGERINSSDLTNYDCNGDGVAASGECFFTPNLVNDRINIYQSVFDLTILLKNLKAGKFDINGDGHGDIVNEIYFVGLSLGAITGSIFAEYNIDDLKKVALVAGGADLASLLDITKISSLASAVESLGLKKNSAEYFVFLGMVHLVLDPCDPLYHVDSKIKDKTLIQTAYGDIIVPNVSNAILSGVIGYSSPTVITDFIDNPDIAEPAAGWYQFGYGNYIVPHTFLLSAENVNKKYQAIDPNVYYDEDFVKKVYEASQTQIINFFNK